jgi:predicted ATPase
MITKFGCKNIKAIKEFDKIEIKPITVIMGENSSGKSSMLQALSLLSVNKTFGNDIRRIKYDNPFSQFGNSDSFKNKDDEIILFFEISEQSTEIRFIYKDDNESKEYGVLQRIDIKNGNLDISFQLENENSLDYSLNINNININENKDISEYLNKTKEDIKISTNLKIINSIQLLTNNESIKNETINSIEELNKALKFIVSPLDVFISNLISIRHIGTIKDKKETYDYGLDYIGYFGEKYKDRALNLKNSRFLKSSIKNIFDYDLTLDKKKQEIFISLEKKKLQLHMFGSSVNSTIPILTQFAKNRDTETKDKYRLTIVEEPELNLHPQSQARFVESVFTKNRPKKQYTILETHSDHILNKLRFLVSQKVIKHQDIVIYYKQKNKKFKKIDINKCGQFTEDFPKGFFDATLDDLYSLGDDC